MQDTIYSFWVEGRLTCHQLLTIHSFLRHGHNFELFVYDTPNDLPPGVVVKQLEHFVPRSELFHYKHMDFNHRLGGFCERVKAELLFQLGGWHVDMDVTCLRHFDMTADYVLRPHNRMVVGNIIRCPAKSDLALRYLEGARVIDEESTDWEQSFLGLGAGVEELGLQKFIVGDDVFGRDDDNWWRFLRAGGGAPDPQQYAIHWCGSFGHLTNEIDRSSFYHALLEEYGLV